MTIPRKRCTSLIFDRHIISITASMRAGDFNFIVLNNMVKILDFCGKKEAFISIDVEIIFL